MTDTETPIAMTVEVRPDPDSRLSQLLARYDAARAAAEEAAAEFEMVKDGIKAELLTAAPGVDTIQTRSPDLSTPLKLVCSRGHRLDSKRLKAEEPVVWVRYATPTESWSLRAVK